MGCTSAALDLQDESQARFVSNMWNACHERFTKLEIAKLQFQAGMGIQTPPAAPNPVVQALKVEGPPLSPFDEKVDSRDAYLDRFETKVEQANLWVEAYQLNKGSSTEGKQFAQAPGGGARPKESKSKGSPQKPKDQGPRCFTCNMKGHRAAQCLRDTKPKFKKKVTEGQVAGMCTVEEGNSLRHTLEIT